MNGGLVIALPSKGRLKAKSEAVMAKAGFAIEQSGQRTYRGRVAGRDDIDVAFLSASEIARELAAGAVHLGITGADLVHETAAAPGSAISLMAPLGFGRNLLGHAMGGENDRDVGGHVLELLDEDGALGLQLLDHEAVVDDLVADVNRRPILLQRPLDNLDSPFDAGTEAARVRQQ